MENNGQNSGNDTHTQTALLQRVGLKIPPFWEESPDIWFAQIEAQFANAQVTTDQTQFNAVVGAIESRILTQVADAVLRPPATNKYENLKEKILEAFSESEHKKMTKLLENIALGDQKPSSLLNEMKRLCTVDISDDFLKTLWLQRLPTQARIMLSTNNVPLAELAKIADKIVEIGNLSAPNGISLASSDPQQDPIVRLTKIVEKLQRDLANRSRSKSRNKSRSRSDNQSSSQGMKRTYENCWYHHRFREKANKCGGTKEAPCNFSKN